ncbi:NAD(P)-dependent dehydrogenase (short-subunit alcohol dehydrogenase family) [Microbacterium halimionae]|uniref:NAD(P)-dependent dehydrogenase (Short-subunit alcohol dehydrogenase family) n=1 Tax=Microbacterium halimionae TaxID=1526413 RepID=A0A7W3PM84_9MICO|nr:SDR family oxidoreductase [Microbacterium halimionae]MBA8816943.1 NAD(P)-dependent dehydrogenase (short-subunit alcohol dehydrogenase family) [Microbacterium halimionae]NII94518.1 NAD(P)-dependent dehydrogenase (short-subunit alcohol dehydrogenase family) [Microbacterium halimionae]
MNSAQAVTAVTGGSRGIGAAIARRLAADGHDVVIGYRDDSTAADEVAAHVRKLDRSAIVAAVDVTDPQSLDSFLKQARQLGRLTGVVAAAGAVRGVGRLIDLDPADLKHDLEVNLLGAVLTSRAAVEHLAESAGSLVLIGSAAATIGSPGSYVHYAAAKAGVAALSVGLSKEVASEGIRVNCVEPGTVWTDFHQDPERPAKVAASIPMGRAGMPEEIAGAVAWLLSPDAAYTTGATLRVAGGL